MLGRLLCWLTHRRWWGVISERKGYAYAFASFECSRCGLLWENRIVGLIRVHPGVGAGVRPLSGAGPKPSRKYGPEPILSPTSIPNMGLGGIEPTVPWSRK